ncbi:putative holin [Azotobacter chroococcum]|uniref:Phage holin n=1 Tax=Azotobacter chroococcum TaxID=353 RepID=A0AAP9YFP8_9GAMM|nr:putative holin [Azotobacter chroococcum]QQE90470.1 hypothetical protein GKQ51_09435 [Azotobacter chroococcum]
MAEVVSAAVTPAAIGASGLALAAFLPGIDVHAVVGSFAGALFLVVFSRDLGAWSRIGYLISSWIFGYYVAVELIGRDIAQSTGLAAFIGSLLCVAISVSLLEMVTNGKVPAWVRVLLKRGRDG